MLHVVNDCGYSMKSYNTNDVDLALELGERVERLFDYPVVPDYADDEEENEYRVGVVDKLHEAGYWLVKTKDPLELAINYVPHPFLEPLVFENWSDLEWWISAYPFDDYAENEELWE